MSAPHLPDDPGRWPVNPYDLLGVPWNVEEKELRRAYVRLIRIYKPEQHPEEFRRIREAYEAVLASLGSGEPAAPPAPLDFGPSAERLPPPQPRLDEAAAAWQLAVRGDVAGATDRLRAMVRTGQAAADVYARLYWLKRTSGEPDARERALAWLEAGLRRLTEPGRLIDLHDAEIEGDPKLVRRPSAHDLILDVASDELATRIGLGHVSALARLGRWVDVRSLMARLKKRLRVDHPALWLQFVMSVIDHVAWEGDVALCRDIRRDCGKEVRELEALGVATTEHLDRFDMIRAAAKGRELLYDMGRVPDRLLDFLPLYWTRPFEQVVPPLRDLLRLFHARPRRALIGLDHLQWYAPAALSVFGSALEAYRNRVEWNREKGLDHESINLRFRSFLAQRRRRAYYELRVPLLKFCAVEGLALHDIREALDKPPAGWEPPTTTYVHMMWADWSLHYVTLASRLFWAVPNPG